MVFVAPTARIASIVGIAATVALFPAAALAQEGDSAAAQALYDQAKALTAEGKYEDACPKFEESERLDPGSGTLLNLADCYEHVGRTASAWSTFLEAATAAGRAGNPEREKGARDRASQLVQKLSKITIDVDQSRPTQGLEVTRDGAPVGRAQWGASVPIDPGPHTVSAHAARHLPWSSDVVILPDGATTVVAVPLLAAAPESAPGMTAPSSTDKASPSSSGLGMQRTLALVAGGIGVVGLGIGTVFGLQSKSKHDEAESHCTGPACRDQTGVDLKSDAISAGNVATAGFVVGLVGVAGGAVLWFTAGRRHDSAPAKVGVGPGSVSVKGVW